VGSIDLAIYDISLFDEEDLSILYALICQSRKGIKVRVIIDGHNARNNPDQHPINRLIAALPTESVILRSPFQDNSAFMHHKFLVIDRRAIWTGSFNFTSSSLNKHHNNGIYIVGREIANAYLKEFNAMWSEANGIAA